MKQNDFIPEIYRAIDSKDTQKFVSYFAEDSVFTNANIPGVKGRDNISVFLDGFFQSIKALNHTELEYWEAQDVWFVTGNANYMRLDDLKLRVPFSVLIRMQNDKIKEFQIFVDNTELYK